MSQVSLKQVDEQIKRAKITELLALNQLGEKTQLESRSRHHAILLFLTSGLIVLISTLISFEGYLTDYLRAGLAIITLLVMAWGYFRGGGASMLGIAAIMALGGIYNLIIVALSSGTIQGTSIIIGTIQIGMALYYIQQANRYQELQSNTQDSVDNDLYQMVYEALDNTQPNNSNNLIELSEFTQSIIVWLRPTGVVILLKGEKRLFFDTNQSFELSINGQDAGGDKINVLAKIIDQSRQCSISRHSWLRYTQYARG